MIDKILKVLGLLSNDLKCLKEEVSLIDKAPAKDGVSPDRDEIISEVLSKITLPKDGVSPDPKDIAIEAAKLVPPSKPGRDAIPPTIRDVSDVVLSKITLPKDGVSPDPKDIAIAAAKLVRVPKDGVSPTPAAVAKKMAAPKRGKDGKDGVSVTDVQLKDNSLFVFLDGKKKNVGKIEVPAAIAPFRPGNNRGGGGGAPIPEITPDNLVIVNVLSNIVTAVETRITFKANTEYRFSNKTVIETALEADFENGAVLTAATQLVESYRYTGTGIAFNGSGVALELRNFGYSAPNGTVFNILNAFPIIINSVWCFDCDKIGTISGVGGATAINFISSAFLNVKSEGLQMPGVLLLLSIFKLFMATTSTGVTLLDWSGSNINDMEITDLEAQAPAGSFVLDGDAGGVNMDAGRVGSIDRSNLSTAALGNALGPGLDEDDAAYKFNDSTVINSRVVGHCYVVTPLTTTIDSGVEVQIEGVYAEGIESSQATCTSDGTVTVENRIEQRGTISVDFDIDKAGGGTQDYIFRAKKVPISTGVPITVDGVFTTVTMTSGASSTFSISGPIRFIAGDKFYYTVEGVGGDDIDVVTQGFTVSG